MVEENQGFHGTRINHSLKDIVKNISSYIRQTSSTHMSNNNNGSVLWSSDSKQGIIRKKIVQSLIITDKAVIIQKLNMPDAILPIDEIGDVVIMDASTELDIVISICMDLEVVDAFDMLLALQINVARM
jgi:hypothetical protein